MGRGGWGRGVWSITKVACLEVRRQASVPLPPSPSAASQACPAGQCNSPEKVVVELGHRVTP